MSSPSLKPSSIADGLEPTQTEAAYLRIRADILSCRIGPGTRLKIGELCKSVSVGLGGVREALSRLHAEGLVIATPQRGYRVLDVSRSGLQAITEARIEVENSCLRLSIARGDMEWEGSVAGALHRLLGTPERNSADPLQLDPRWNRFHASLHDCLVDACNNPWLLGIRRDLFEKSQRYRNLSVPLATEKRDLESEHRDLIHAALARDAERACLLLREHLERTRDILLNSDYFNQD